MSENNVKKIGWIASFLGILMYFSYIDQIRLNISGQPGSIILPIVTTVNCTFWALYAFLKEKKDWPLFVCNLPGIILGIITAITAIIYR